MKRLLLLLVALTFALQSSAFAAMGSGNVREKNQKNYWRSEAQNWGTEHCRGADMSGCIPKSSAQQAQPGTTR